LAIGALWTRSYTWYDGSWTSAPYASFMSIRGLIIITFTGNPLKDPIHFSDFSRHWDSRKLEHYEDPPWWEKESLWGFACLEPPPGRAWISFPHWALTVFLGLLAAGLALGRRLRFSIRNLLMITTALALLLGVAVYTFRS
jgi:hypothetical protein